MNGLRAVAVLACAGAMAASDWDRFRGPNGSGVGDDVAGPAEFGPDKNVVWKTVVPAGLSSPVLSGNSVFLTGIEEDRLVTIRLDRSTGAIVWKRALERQRQEKLHKLNHAASPSPAADRQAVYVFFPDFGLAAYGRDGKELWRKPLGPFQNTYGMGVSPILTADAVVLVCDQSKDSFIAAFGKKDGRLLWKTARPHALSGHSTPILHRAPSGGWQILAPGSFRLDAYDAASGREAWHFEGLPGEMKSVPVVDGDTVFVHGFNTPENDPGNLLDIPAWSGIVAKNDVNGDKRLDKQEAPAPHSQRYFRIIDLNGDGFLNEPEWEQYRRLMRAENALLAIGLDGRLKWKFQRSIPQLPSPLLYRGVIYMVNEGGILTTLEASTGKLYKQLRVPAPADNYYGSPVAAGGRLYVVSHTGNVVVLQAGPEPALVRVNALEEDCLATPALAEGRLYLRTSRTLYCFAERR